MFGLSTRRNRESDAHIKAADERLNELSIELRQVSAEVSIKVSALSMVADRLEELKEALADGVARSKEPC